MSASDMWLAVDRLDSGIEKRVKAMGWDRYLEIFKGVGGPMRGNASIEDHIATHLRNHLRVVKSRREV